MQSEYNGQHPAHVVPLNIKFLGVQGPITKSHPAFLIQINVCISSQMMPLLCRYGTDSQIEFFKMLDKKIEEVRYCIKLCYSVRKLMLSIILHLHRVLIFMKSRNLMKEPDNLLRQCADYSRQYTFWSLTLATPT